ncbi:MAG: hypothetical protein LPK85_09575, partial [Gammaproteobacteria bacterium]|nr:hypothetical protein [Gammaproteobacteria bacterium]
MDEAMREVMQMICKRPSFIPQLVSVAVGFACLVPASAAERVLEVGTNMRATDNSAKEDELRQDEQELRPFIRWAASTDPDQCALSTKGELGYVDYLRNTFGDENSVLLVVNGSCQASRYFNWAASNDLRDVSTNASDIDTPANRVRRNQFSTGPTYWIPLTSTDRLVLSALYQNTEYRDALESDSNRGVAKVDWRHAFDSTFSSSVTYLFSRVMPDTNEDIDFNSVQLELEKQWQLSRLAGSVGYVKADSDSREGRSTSWSLAGERQISSLSSVGFSVSRKLIDIYAG